MSVTFKSQCAALLFGSLLWSTLAAGQVAVQDFYKVVFFSTKKADMSQQEFIDYSIEKHVPLVKKIPGLRGYVLNFADPTSEDPAYHAVVELWFDDQAAADKAFASAEGQAAIADQANFLAGSPQSLAVQERMPIYPERPAEGSTDHSFYKAVYLVERHPQRPLEETLLAQFRDYVPVAIGGLGSAFTGYQIDYVEEINPDLPLAMVVYAWFTSKEDVYAAFQSVPAMAKLDEISQTYYGRRQNFDVIEYVAIAPPTLVK